MATIFPRHAHLHTSGKPSKGCANCRARKIKCDQGVPSCGQCMKAERRCPGYRNMVDLAFRDESSAVVEKAKARARARKELGHASSSTPKRPSSKSRLSAASSPEPSSTSSASSSIINFAPSSIEDRAINCFLNNWVSKGSGPSHGYFNYCHELLGEDAMGSVLRTSVIASGLAIEANTNRDSQLLVLARRNYALALSKINSALRSPAEAVKDSILLSIIVVAVFEVCCGSNQLSMKAWTEHINGASALIRMRGRSQLRNQISRGVFIYGTSHLLLSEIPMHPEILDLRKEAFLLVPSDPGWKFLKKSDECTVFRGAIKSGDLTDPEVIILTALRLDNDIIQIFNDAPISWMYETVYTDSSSPLVFSGTYDIYYDHWVAQIWNGSRCIRIGLNETIRSQLVKGFASNQSFNTPENFAQFQASTQTVTQMRDEILRSVPQHVGLVPQSRKPFQNTPFHSNTTPPLQQYFSSDFGFSLDNLDLNLEAPVSFTDLFSAPDFVHFEAPSQTLTPDPSFPAISGSFLLWPIYVAAITRVSQQEHRIFASRVLTYIGENMGIRQATNMASFIQAHPAFERMETGKSKGSAVLDEWNSEAPIQPLREMFEREEKEAELIRAAGQELMRSYGEGGDEGQPSATVAKMYRY
ncbi:hypothetical protein N431DRAFT_545029 [Stipitochalara longipes BDJ]|nr:hypothetical protein N431DRAFT_545029 [Stipitochalara longipes BDJ]